MTATLPVAILGSGFAGMCMAIRLLEAGRDDFVIFEKASSLGGTWRDNTYPGCACDVPSHLYSFSSWVLPRNDRPTSTLARSMFARLPPLQRFWRAVQFWYAEAFALGFTVKPKLMGRGQKRSDRYMRSIVKDKALADRMMPMYTMGCNRVLISDNYYQALTRDNIELVTESIAAVRPHSIVTADGRERAVDVIIHATGFKPFDPSRDMHIQGRGGRTLAADWPDGPEAFHGVAVAGYPNYFMLMGPNSGLGQNSIIFMIETQVNYILQCLAWLDRGRSGQPALETVEVREDVQRAFNDALQRKFDKSVWKSDGSVWELPCKSWYQHRSGKFTAIWPSFAITYRLALRKADRGHFLPKTAVIAETGGEKTSAASAA